MKYYYLPIVVLLIGFAGCMQTATTPKTASGKPEVTIATKDVAKVKNAIVNSLMDGGWTIESVSEFQVVCRGTLSGGEQFLTAMSVGNAHSNNYRSVVYTIVPVDAGVRVVVGHEIKAAMPGGQVNSLAMDGNSKHFAGFQAGLDRLKSQVESAP